MKNKVKGIDILVDDAYSEKKKILKYFLAFELKEKDTPAEIVRKKRSNTVIINSAWSDFKYLLRRIIGSPIFFIKTIIYKIDRYIDSISYYDLRVGGVSGKVISRYGIKIDKPTKIVDISKDNADCAEIGVYVRLEKEEENQ